MPRRGGHSGRPIAGRGGGQTGDSWQHVPGSAISPSLLPFSSREERPGAPRGRCTGVPLVAPPSSRVTAQVDVPAPPRRPRDRWLSLSCGSGPQPGRPLCYSLLRGGGAHQSTRREVVRGALNQGTPHRAAQALAQDKWASKGPPEISRETLSVPTCPCLQQKTAGGGAVSGPLFQLLPLPLLSPSAPAFAPIQGVLAPPP